jgi:hypothetical protein
MPHHAGLLARKLRLHLDASSPRIIQSDYYSADVFAAKQTTSQSSTVDDISWKLHLDQGGNGQFYFVRRSDFDADRGRQDQNDLPLL